MKLHLLTAVTRLRNLSLIADSIAAASFPDWEIVWHLSFDFLHQDVGGHELKNAMLDGIEDGWVWILDDDTTMHPGLLKRLDDVLHEADAPVRALIVSQDRHDGRHLTAAEENVRVGEIDAGQAIMRRDMIGDHRLPLDYEGDGHWLCELLPGKDGVVYLDETLSLHNALA